MKSTTDIQFVLIGSGKIGTQPTATNAVLPTSYVKAVETPVSSAGASGASTATNVKSAASRLGMSIGGVALAGLGVVVGGLLL